MTSTTEGTLSGPELDYAFLAEYASITPNGTLSAIGASFTQLTVANFPAQQMLTVAGRIRVPSERVRPLDITVTIEGPPRPSGEPNVKIEMGAQLGLEGPLAYDNKLGLLFAITTLVPVLAPGLHSIVLDIEGEHARTLKFAAVSPAPST